jgi:hypothetical protein
MTARVGDPPGGGMFKICVFEVDVEIKPKPLVEGKQWSYTATYKNIEKCNAPDWKWHITVKGTKKGATVAEVLPGGQIDVPIKTSGNSETKKTGGINVKIDPRVPWWKFFDFSSGIENWWRSNFNPDIWDYSKGISVYAEIRCHNPTCNGRNDDVDTASIA